MADKVMELWRPFIAAAPDFQLEVKSGNSLRIPMSEYMRQGAVSLADSQSPLVEGEDPLFANSPVSKRGWLYNLAILGQAKYGKVIYDHQRRGFLYESKSNYVGEDCFNYVLTNGKQVSYTGKINIDVLENYRLLLEVEENEYSQYRIKATVNTPEGEPIPTSIYFNWYYIGPFLKTGKVHIGRDYFTGTRITTRGYGSGVQYVVLRKGDTWGFDIPVHENDFKDNIDSRTGLLFEPIDRFNDMEVEAEIRLEGKGWRDPADLVLVARLSDFYGRPWENSGLLPDPNAPDQDELDGKSTPPYMKQSTTLVESNQVPDVL